MHSIKRILFRAIVRLFEWMTLSRKPKKVCHLSLMHSPESVDLITVAFNNAELIKIQEQFLKRYIQDAYYHIIVDNSTDVIVREKIYNYCLDNNIAYISLPYNWLNKIGSSYSHACALNYVYRHIIRKRQPYAFGQIDHDLFPVQKLSILEYLKDQPVYGPLRQRNECWYLSAIMSFFRYEFVCDKKVDFMPVTPVKTYLDSGGGNWYKIYSQLNMNQLIFPEEHIEKLREGGDRHGDSLEWFDNKRWLHTINGSCWKPVEAGKENMVRELLNSYLQSC